MKKSIYFFLVILLFISVSCANVCERPFIRHASSCCLDNNSNSICDDDEKIVLPETQLEIINEIKEKIIEEKPVIKETPVKDPLAEPNISFKVELSAIKDNIRLVDQAIFKMTIFNYDNSLDHFIISTADDRWKISVSPLMVPIRLAVASNSRNYIRLVIQPNKKYISESGNYSLAFDIVSDKDSEKSTAEAEIIIK